MADTRFAVRELVLERIEGYAIKHPDTGILVSNRSVANGYCIPPETFPLAAAMAHAEQLKVETGESWGVELAPNPCPNCGRVIWADDGDFCYPLNRERTKWRAGCNEHDFGCGAEFEGTSFEDVMKRWNTGA